MACDRFTYNGQEYTKEEILHLISTQGIDPMREVTTLDDINTIKTTFGVGLGETLQNFMERTQGDLFEKIKQFNPEVQISFNEDETSGYSPGLNQLDISLKELHTMAIVYGINPDRLLKYTIEHEAMHSIQIPAIDNSPNLAKQLETIRKRVLTLHNQKPFIDLERNGYIGPDGLPRSLSDIYEMASDAISNPYFKEYLKSIGKENQTLWQKIIDFLRSALGLAPIDNVYTQIDNLVNTKDFFIQNKEAFDRSSNDLMQLVEKQGMYQNIYKKGIYQGLIQRKDEFEELFDEIKDKLSSLYYNLNNTSNYTQKKVLRNLMDEYEDVGNNIDKIEIGIKTIQALWQITETVQKGLRGIDSLPDYDQLVRLQAYITEASSFDDMIPYINKLLIEIDEIPRSNKHAQRLKSQLRAIANIKGEAQQKYTKIVRPLLTNILGTDEANFPTAMKINDQILETRTRINELSQSSGNESKIKILNDKIKRLTKSIAQLPTTQNFKKLFENNSKDVSWTDLMLVSSALNSSAFIQRLTQLIKDKDIELSAATNTVLNQVQSIKDTFVSKKGNVKNKDIVEAVTHMVQIADKVIEEDENGQPIIQYKETKAWKHNYTPEYIKDFTTYQVTRTYFSKKRFEEPEKYEAIYDKYSKEYIDWRKQNVTNKYEDAFYEQFEVLAEPITKDDGSTTTLLKERKGLFADLEDLETERLTGLLSGQALIQLEDRIEAAQSEIRKIASPYDEETGEKKTGFALKMYEQAKKYQLARNKAVEYIESEEGLQRHTIDLQDIENHYQNEIASIEIDEQVYTEQHTNQVIDTETFKKRMTILKNQRDEALRARDTQVENTYTISIDQRYFNEKVAIKNSADAILLELSSNPDLAQFLSNSNVTEGFKEISDRSNPYRDKDGVINGQIIPEKTAVGIRDMEQKILDLQDEVTNLKNVGALPTTKQKRQEELAAISPADLTQEQRLEIEQLNQEAAQRRKIYTDNAEKIGQYEALLKRLYDMSVGSTTDYYQRRKDQNLKELQARESKRAKDKEKDLDAYFKANGYTKKGKNYYNPVNKHIGTDPDVVLDNVAMSVARAKEQSTKWWKDNHIEVTYMSREGMVTEQRPIYIWRRSTPRNPAYIKRTVAFKYKKPNVIAKENPDFRPVVSKLGAPKKSSSYYRQLNIPEEFLTLRNSLMDVQKKTEEESGMEDNQRLYDIIPGIPKHSTELKSDFLNKGLSGELFKNIKRNVVGRGTEDEQFEQEGSQSLVFYENRNVPFRFNNALSSEKQTNDLFYVVLRYFNTNLNAYNMKTLEPIFQAALFATKDLGVVETNRRSGAFNLWKVLRGKFNNPKGQETIQEIQKDETNLHKMIDHMTKTAIYGQVRNNAVIDTPFGAIDAHKVVGTTKAISSHSIFAFKIFGPLKNTIAGKINFLINANQGEGFFTRSDAAHGTYKASTQIKDLLDDYKGKKFGNKSHTGQSVQFFQVLNGGMHDAFGRYTSFNALTEGINYMTVVKNSSEIELQLAVFNAIAHANQLKLADGTSVNFNDAYEVNNGEFKLKTGTTKPDGSAVTQEDVNKLIYKVQFINRFVNGAFRQEEKSLFEKNPLGNLAFYLNGFVVPGLINRYGSEYYSYEADNVVRGYYSEAMHFFREVVKYKGEIKFLWKELKPEERQRVIRFTSEITIAAIAGALGMMLGSGDTKKELRKRSDINLILLALTIQSASELQTFIPVPGLGWDELIRKINNPFAATRQLTTLAKFVGNTLSLAMYPFDGESGTFKRGTGIDDGFHDQGDIKALADALKLVGISHAEISPLEKVMQAKQAQVLR